MSAKLHETKLEAAAEQQAWLSDPSEQYAAGYHEGRAWGEQDRADGLSETSYWLASFTADAATGPRASRARMLGVLRGYREAVRTQGRDGRWGT